MSKAKGPLPPATPTKITEFYGLPTLRVADWKAVAAGQHCPYLGRKCRKNRKSTPGVTIGTCTMGDGQDALPTMICPFRLLERSQIFTDCLHLLTLHEPGNELRIVGELAVPGGSVDYCLVSVRDGKPRDFVAIELQTMDTTGTVWPERQRFLRGHSVPVKREDATSHKSFGMNWKMTAKTALVQLHHKIETFDHLGKHLVLVLQDRLLDYMRRKFTFDHIEGVRVGHPMHFHAYELRRESDAYTLNLKERASTDVVGVATCLRLRRDTKVELVSLFKQIEEKLPKSTPLTIGGAAVPVSKSADVAAADA